MEKITSIKQLDNLGAETQVQINGQVGFYLGKYDQNARSWGSHDEMNMQPAFGFKKGEQYFFSWIKETNKTLSLETNELQYRPFADISNFRLVVVKGLY